MSDSLTEPCRACGAPTELGWICCRACDRKAAADQLAREHERWVAQHETLSRIADSLDLEETDQPMDVLGAVQALRARAEAAEKERDEMCASRADAIMEKHAERAAKEEALAALAAAPHDPECVRWMALGRVDGEIAACRCWKSRAPGREEAAALRALVAWRHDGAPGSSGDFRNRELQEAAAALVATNRWR